MESELRPARIAAIFAFAFVLGLVLLVTWQSRVTNYWPLGVDVYSHTVHTRAFWQGTSPYAEQVQHDAEQLVYGRARLTGEPPFPFTYPAYLALLLFPLILLPTQFVGVVWGAAMFAVLATIVIVRNLALIPKPSGAVGILLVLGGITFRPALLSIINGQYALFVVACVFLAAWLCMRRYDYWLGIPLALATVKPSVGLFLPIIILVWAVRWRRWHIVISLIGVTLFLMIATIARIGWWLPDFMYHTATYSALREGIGLAWSIEQLSTIPGMVWLLLTLGLLALGVWRLRRDSRFPWLALIAALNLNLLLTPHTVEYDLTMLLIPLFWLGAECWGHRWGAALWLVLVWTPWISWLAVIAMTQRIELWWTLIWQFYPSLLVGGILFLLAWTRVHRSDLSGHLTAASGAFRPSQPL